MIRTLKKESPTGETLSSRGVDSGLVELPRLSGQSTVFTPRRGIGVAHGTSFRTSWVTDSQAMNGDDGDYTILQ